MPRSFGRKIDRIKHRSLIGSAIIGFLVFILLISSAPDAVPYSSNNYGWNGAHNLYSSYHVIQINSVSNLNSQNESKSVLLIVQPVSNYSLAESDAIKHYLDSGGFVVIADSLGESNALLNSLGVGITVDDNLMIQDQTYNWKNPSLPTALILSNDHFKFASSVKALGVNVPSPLVIEQGAQAVGISSPFSVALTRSSSLFSSSEKVLETGPFAVAGAEKIGNGTVLVIGDSSFFTDSELGIANNGILARNLFQNSTVYVDTSHWPVNTVSSLKAEIAYVYSSIAFVPTRYVLTLGIVGLALFLFPYGKKIENSSSI
jgi:hypothetical protein